MKHLKLYEQFVNEDANPTKVKAALASKYEKYKGTNSEEDADELLRTLIDDFKPRGQKQYDLLFQLAYDWVGFKQTFLKWGEYDAYVRIGEYDNGRKAIQLFNKEDGDYLAVPSVNLPEENIAKDEVIIDDGKPEYEGLMDALIKAKIISKPVREIGDGYKVCKLLMEVNESEEVPVQDKPAKTPKTKGPYIIQVDYSRPGSERTKYVIGSVEDLVGYFGYTLEVGHSWKRSIPTDPKTIKQFVKALKDSYDQKEANLYNRTGISLVDAVPEGTPEASISDLTKKK